VILGSGAPQIPIGSWGDEFALEHPGRQLHVSGHKSEEVLLPLASLNGDMDVVMTVGEVRSGTTLEPWKVRTFDDDEHAAHRHT
jgi:hypothetical protein